MTIVKQKDSTIWELTTPNIAVSSGVK